VKSRNEKKIREINVVNAGFSAYRTISVKKSRKREQSGT